MEVLGGEGEGLVGKGITNLTPFSAFSQAHLKPSSGYRGADKAGNETAMDNKHFVPMWLFPFIPALVDSQPMTETPPHLPPCC